MVLKLGMQRKKSHSNYVLRYYGLLMTSLLAVVYLDGVDRVIKHVQHVTKRLLQLELLERLRTSVIGVFLQ